MPGDYTRFTFDPRNRYSSVFMQQGRLYLDQDKNADSDIQRYAQRALAEDVLGRYGVSFARWPDAFLVGHVGAPPEDLSIGEGRLYIDGLRAEHFPGEGATYLHQPFLPLPPPLPAGEANIYLRMWDREITYLENPGLLDFALGGNDTTTRLQTVWQVLVEEAEQAACALAPPLVSAGRLTTGAVAPPAPDDPCIVPPLTGYRGIENRTYNVMIFEGGPLGVARFMFSRDAGSVASAVLDMAVGAGQTTLTVNRIGRDPVLRFRAGDWVTVTDDVRELMLLPPEPAQVVDIDEANRRIVLDRVLPAANPTPFGANAAEIAARHTKIIRWDQTGALAPIDADGLITAVPGPIDLEDGIQVEFTMAPAGGEFLTGDNWLFAARTADASVEELVAQPPRRVYHMVQLGAAHGLGSPNAFVEDCRPQPQDPVPGEGEGCCTVVVRPGESIQTAIDALPAAGGCVCIKAGVHPVPATILVNRSNVRLHGESPGAVLQGAATLLQVGVGVAGIRIDMLEFVARIPSSRGGQAIVEVAGASDVLIQDCSFAPFDGTFGGIALNLLRADRARIAGNRITNTDFGIVLAGLCSLPVIEDNLMTFGLERDFQGAATGIWINGVPSACRIEENMILGAHRGIAVNNQPFEVPRSPAASSIVEGNYVLGSSIGGEGPSAAIGIDAAADFMSVDGNQVVVASPEAIGIRVTGSGCTLRGNMLGASIESAPGVLGIQVGFQSEEGASTGTAEVTVTGSQVAGSLSGVLVLETRSATLRDNNIVIQGKAGSYAGIVAYDSPLLLLGGNRVSGGMVGIGSRGGRNASVDGNTVMGNDYGIVFDSETRPSLSANTVEGAGSAGILFMQIQGRTETVRNRVIGTGRNARFAVGIGGAVLMGEWELVGNEVIDTGLGEDAGARAFGILGQFILQAQVSQNLVTYTDPLSLDPSREDRALYLLGVVEVVQNFGNQQFILGYPVQILGNKFSGAGLSALVELDEIPLTDNYVVRFEHVLFSDNYCFHNAGEIDETRATVVLHGRAATVGGNQVKATRRGYFSFDFNRMRGPYFGNVVSGNALQYAGFVPAPDGQNNMVL